MKRSGSHAVINWICSQHSSAVYFSGCKVKNNRIEPRWMNIYKEGNYIKRLPDKIDNSLYDLVIYNFEIENFQNLDLLDYLEKQNVHEVLKVFDAKIIILIRDPFNMVASRLQFWSKQNTAKSPGVVWKRLVKQCLNSNKYIIDINYNEWFCSKRYREDLANRLQINFNDNGLNKVLGYGISSFDGYKFDNKAQDMDVLNRWKNYRNNDIFWKEIDAETIKLSKEYCKFEIR
jgi:hypothetical protein